MTDWQNSIKLVETSKTGGVMNLEFSILQNGSDIRGIAMPGVPGEPVNLTSEHVKYIGYAFALWLEEKTKKSLESLSISVGVDSRLTGATFEDTLVHALSDLNITTYSCGLASTPSMFMSTKFQRYNCDGAVMITASHLPYNRNGLKFFTKESGLDKKDITAILKLAKELHEDGYHPEGQGKIIPYKLTDVYADYLVHKIRKETSDLTPLEKYKIVVDAGNGAGGFFAIKILKPLGASIEGSQFLEPDGTFPNHIPNPEDPEAMDSLKKAVIENNGDLGIIFDTDVDRAAIVDSDGGIINRNALIALMSIIVLDEFPGTTIVTDSVTSDGLTTFIEAKGGKHHRFKRGYKNVINESKRLNDIGIHSGLAIETSGHGALKENFFLDDGAYMMTKILIKLASLDKDQKIGDLIKDLKKPKEAAEYRVPILIKDFKTYGNKLMTDLKDHFENLENFQLSDENYEGVRVRYKGTEGDGWFLVRLSLHDPILPINVESDFSGGVSVITSKLKKFLSSYDSLDLETIL